MTDAPFVLVTVRGGIAEVEVFGGATAGIIDWDALPGEGMEDEELREALEEAREEVWKVPDARIKAALFDDLDEIEKKHLGPITAR